MNPFSFSEYIIRKDNLINNIKVLRSKIADSVELVAVVKADAYGVGSENISKIIEPMVDGFAVANLGEAIELRNAGIIKKILVLGAVDFDSVELYSKYKISLTINSLFEMNKLSRLAKNPIMVEFGVNSGMNRFGFSSKSEILSAKEVLNENEKILLVGAYSHLATKEDDVKFIYEQKKVFDNLTGGGEFSKVKLHLSNTNGILNHQDLNYDGVRTGFGLYGMSKNDFGLKPVVEIKSRIVHISNVSKGQSVGYDRTFFVGKDKTIGVVPLGYFDGINRRVSNFGEVIVGGRKVKILGRVCMDSMMVDLSGVDAPYVGMEVVVLGEQGKNKIMLEDYAAWADTSEYECLIRFNRKRMREILCY